MVRLHGRSDFRSVLSRRRLLGSAALGSAGAAFLSACGGSGDDTPSQSGGAGGAAAPAGTTAAGQKEPVRGGQLNFMLGGDPPNLDMHANSTYLVNMSMAPIYNNLVQFDPDQAQEKPDTIIGDLAKSWELSGDGLTYTFKLNEGVTFHDDKAFTSADVKATIERVANPPSGVVSPRQDSLTVVSGIETPDTSTVVVKLKQPAPSLLTILSQGWMSIYAAEDIKNGFDFNTKTNGTGPFKLKEYLRGNRVVMEPNPSYFVQGQPYLAGMTAFIIPNAGSRVSSFQSGQVNFTSLLTKSDLTSLEAVLKDRMVVERLNGYGFNTINFGHRDPWRDERVRRAISLAMNRQESIDLLYEGEGTLGGYMPGGGSWALSASDLQALPGYASYSDKTVAEAKQLLSAAGVQSGLETTILTRRGKSYEDLSIFIKDNLTKVGIEAKPQVLEDAAAYDALNERAFDLAPWAHAIALDDPDAVFAEFYLSESPRNYSGLGSKEVDDLFAKQSQTLDQQARATLVQEMQKKALPLYGKVILAWAERRWTWWNKVENYTAHVGLYNNNRHAATWVAK
ncbi:MAG: ABC transporter substrate-binding protein [Dehalococcoidia bacterium]